MTLHLSIYSLKDRIILSLTNKYLTKLFDPYFEDSSFAFRPKKNEDNKTISHHDCIKKINVYLTENKDKILWSVECDMKKFYDTVNHQIIRDSFNKLIDKVKKDNQEVDLSLPIHIFEQYLQSYSFNKNVLPLNNNPEYWRKHSVNNGKYDWVENDLIKSNFYCEIKKEDIGIPQGGALSGLIANMVLDAADKEIKKNDVFYIRFCDDMIILSQEEKICKEAEDKYLACLKQLKLIPHDINNVLTKRKLINNSIEKVSFSPFWKCKSKGPYKWGPSAEGGFPWIGFVGYEIHHKGFIRVRKSSLKKEFQKQKETVQEIMKVVVNGARKSKKTISESVINRLISMSVGRINLRNYKTASSDLCWKNGFKELNMNKYSSKQMKMLDRNRNKQYYKLKRFLNTVSFNNNDKRSKSVNRKIIFYGKPFSYYYQVLIRKD